MEAVEAAHAWGHGHQNGIYESMGERVPLWNLMETMPKAIFCSIKHWNFVQFEDVSLSPIFIRSLTGNRQTQGPTP